MEEDQIMLSKQLTTFNSFRAYSGRLTSLTQTDQTIHLKDAQLLLTKNIWKLWLRWASLRIDVKELLNTSAIT